jgi:hypothetical protein
MAYKEASSQMITLTRTGNTWSWDGSRLIPWETEKNRPRSQTRIFDGTWTQLP